MIQECVAIKWSREYRTSDCPVTIRYHPMIDKEIGIS